MKTCKECGHQIEEVKTLTIKNEFFDTRYELEQHDNNKLLSEIKIPKGKRLLKPWEAQRLWDLGQFREGWIFVENTNKEEKNKGNVARFDASYRANLDCDRNPSDRYSNLGVIFAEDLK